MSTTKRKIRWPRYFAIPTYVFELIPRMTGSEAQLYMALCAGDRGWHEKIIHGNEDLMNATGLNDRTFRRAREGLRNLGLLAFDKYDPRGRKYRYLLIAPQKKPVRQTRTENAAPKPAPVPPARKARAHQGSKPEYVAPAHIPALDLVGITTTSVDMFGRADATHAPGSPAPVPVTATEAPETPKTSNAPWTPPAPPATTPKSAKMTPQKPAPEMPKPVKPAIQPPVRKAIRQRPATKTPTPAPVKQPTVQPPAKRA